MKKVNFEIIGNLREGFCIVWHCPKGVMSIQGPFANYTQAWDYVTWDIDNRMEA